MLLLIFLFGSYIMNALKILSPPNKGANQTGSPKKARKSMANEKSPPHLTTLRSPSFLSPFEIIYGRPFLFPLGNVPPTDPASLTDYWPYLNLLRELLREHGDHILPTPQRAL
jgi:hypothetical protein